MAKMAKNDLFDLRRFFAVPFFAGVGWLVLQTGVQQKRQRRRRQLARHRRRLEEEREKFTAMYLFEINALAVCIKPLLFIKIIKF